MELVKIKRTAFGNRVFGTHPAAEQRRIRRGLIFKGMRGKRIHAYLTAFQGKYPHYLARRATNLLIFQAIFLALLLMTAILVCFVDHGGRLAFYLALLGVLLLLIAAALVFIAKGHYYASAWLTTICMVLGPWGSILLDPAVLAGDYLPLIYVGISIQLCSILLSERATLAIAIVQLGAVTAAILCNPGLRSINWPSLVCFIVFTATIGILAGFSNRKQLEQIERQRNSLLENEAKLRDLSVRDPLTGLFNRRYMEETLDREISRAKRRGCALAVSMVDIDGFKSINDTYGHVLGDGILVSVAKHLSGGVRASDVACRFGGDEFFLILPECTMEEALRRADAMRRGTEEMAFHPSDARSERVTLSFGVAAFPENGSSREELLAAADKALYAAKRSGRNCVIGQACKAGDAANEGEPDRG